MNCKDEGWVAYTTAILNLNGFLKILLQEFETEKFISVATNLIMR